MARTSVRRPSQVRGRRTASGLVIAGVVIVLFFALVGVVSAGRFVADKASSSPAATATPRIAGGQTEEARLAVIRAHAQATAIVQHAQLAGQSIVNLATSRANKQVKRMLAQARRRARAVPTSVPQAAALVPTAIPYQPAATAVPGALTSPTSLAASSGTGPNLSGLPASWKVVGYNATFGSGPGSAGSITVTNRSSGTFSGSATVAYAHGGSATASFARLSPGQTEVLALNGRAYTGGDYTISVTPH